MTTEVVVVPIRKIILDIVLVMCVGFPILFMFLWASPFKRGFFCHDEELIHPFHPSTVPSLYLYIVGIVMNCIVITMIELLNPPHTNQKIVCMGLTIPNRLYNAYNVILVLALGMAFSQLTTDVMKYTVGRLRPHFLPVCVPNINCTLPENLHKYHVNYECTNPQYMNNKRIMKEIGLSFPSGHSSFSMYSMLFFAIYLQKRMDWDGSKLLRHVLQFLAILAAVYTAMTRISDYKHHWSDVLIGMAIGTIVACITARFFSNLFDQPERHSLLKADETELHGHNNGNC